jgi:hypothetical protein
MEKINYTVVIDSHGCMLNDYFSGTTGVWLNIPVDKNSTVEDILEGLKQEIISVEDHIFYTGVERYGMEEEDIELGLKTSLDNLMELNKDRLKVQPFLDILDFTFDDMVDDEEYPVQIITIEFVEV